MRTFFKGEDVTNWRVLSMLFGWGLFSIVMTMLIVFAAWALGAK